ncbi:unnamed protein product [Rhodiola kirilowii]
MSRLFSDRPLGGLKRNNITVSMPPPISATAAVKLPSPFAGDLMDILSPAELRETAYEIFLASCRASGPRPLTFVSQAEKLDRSGSSASSLGSSASLHRSLSSSTTSKVKKVLGLKSRNGESVKVFAKRSMTVGEVMRVQMRVSEMADSRIRRALLRIFAGQLGKRIESIVLPLELIQQFKPSDFSNQIEYEAWQRRMWKLLETGLIISPYLSVDKSDPSVQGLQKIIQGALESPIDTGKYSETMQVVRNLVLSLATRTFDGSFSDTCHWADGTPLNLRLYQVLLEACFDSSEDTSIIEEADEILELLKKTWKILGMNQLLHNICFSWILFNRYVSTGEVGDDLLFATNNLLPEIEQDVKDAKDAAKSKIIRSMLTTMMGWAEKKLHNYHYYFHASNVNLLQNVLSLGLSAAKILEDTSVEPLSIDISYEKVKTYIRSSLSAAFRKKMEKLNTSINIERKSSSTILTMLAQELSKLAFSEREIFSPVLSRWNQHAAGLAVATLHACYGDEFKKYVFDISELAPDSVNVLISADKLEKDLVQIAVEESIESEDGGKSIIRDMLPFEAEDLLASLVKSWIQNRVDSSKEWVARNFEQEVWKLHANKEHCAPSAIEVLRLVDESVEAFFCLPITMHAVLLPDLINGLDKCLQLYVLMAQSGSGTKSTYLPAMPALTRCRKESKFHGVFKNKDRFHVAQIKKSQVENLIDENTMEMSQLCVRINSLQHIRTQLEALSRRTIARLKDCQTAPIDDITNRPRSSFDLSAGSCLEGIHQLCEAAAYKVVFHDLRHLLSDGLYVGGVHSSRIEPYLLELERNLEVISSTVHDRVRTRMITDLMKASFDGFLLVLLAGGPSRSFTLQDSAMIEEDFGFLKDLFWSNGDGLPLDLIDKHSTTLKGIIPLFRADTQGLIERFNRLILEAYGSSEKSQPPLPPTTGQWHALEPNTLLRVLCYRNDAQSIKFLKKTYNLPKKL